MPNAIADIQTIVDRSYACGQDSAVIARAVQVLGLDVRDIECDHPLIDLYQTLLFSTPGSSLVQLSPLHKELLAQAISRIQRDPSTVAHRQTAADRLRQMARRSTVHADELRDIELALDTLGIDILKDRGGELVELYRNLLAKSAGGEARCLSVVERLALIRAAQALALD